MKIKKLSSLILSVLLCLGINANNNEKWTNNKSTVISDTLDVLHYEINLDLFHLSTKKIKGYTELKITPKVNNVNGIKLDLLRFNIDSITINNVNQLYNYNDTLLKILLPTALTTNDTIDVRIYYNGQPTIEAYNWGGFHFSNDSSIAYNLGVAFDADPHNYGRGWFPCIDDFVDRATYDFFIKVKNDKKAICNGLLINIADNGDGSQTYHWKLEQTIPTYLANIAVSDFVEIQGVFNGINGAIPTYLYVKKSDSLDAANSFVNLNNVTEAFEYYFGPYAWPRIGYVGTTKGAMEHPTNISYPVHCFTGDLTYEYLYAHELAHSWFGDQVTCSSEGDMWINEGWAVFCEAIYRERVYNRKSYKDYLRTKHRDVLQLTHITDNGYRALSPIPHEYTYGSTVYDKGGSVVQSLKGYLGEDRFFNTVKEYLNQYSFKEISSVQLRDFITGYTGINMTDFFDAWVFSPGFPHFSVDSFIVHTGSLPEKTVDVYVRQKLKGVSTYAQSNRIPISFFDYSGNMHTDTVYLSGQSGQQTFTVPFAPIMTLLDVDEEICDATTDYLVKLKNIGQTDFSDALFQLDVQQITDSCFFRIEHSWVAPDPLKSPITGLTLSDARYWKIDFPMTSSWFARGKFQYSKGNHIDNNLITNVFDSLVILYRENTATDWHPINFTMVGSPFAGYLIVDYLLPGEYTLAIWDEAYIGGKNNIKEEKILKIHPNPSSKDFILKYNIDENAIINIYDSKGAKIDSINVNYEDKKIKWETSGVKSGTYYIQLKSIDGKLLAKEKAILVK